MEQKIIQPIATIKNNFKEKFGIPRQSGRAPSILSEISFIGKYNNVDAIRCIEEFSHLYIIFGFSKNPETENISVRPPRLGGNKKVGVFASRSPFRPNGLGLSIVKLIKVDTQNGVKLIVSGADILEGSPIYDIKPYIPFTDKIDNAIGGYAQEFYAHKLKVIIDDKLKILIPEEHFQAICECLADDPRPPYHNDGRVYGMKYANLNIKFSVNKDTLTVLSVDNNF